MKTLNKIGICLLAMTVLALIGCGGSGGGDGGTTTGGGNPSPFNGRWRGTYEGVLTDDPKGTIEMTFASNGSFQATATETNSGDKTTASGNIKDDGTLTGSAVSGGASATVGGKLELDGSGAGATVSGYINLTSGDNFQQYVLQMRRG